MRGVKNLKTASGRVTRAGVDQQSRSYHLFMQVTCLEMERVRRSTERAAAARRIDEIDERIREIDEEKSGLLAQLNQRGDLVQPATTVRPPAERPGDRPFRIQY